MAWWETALKVAGKTSEVIGSAANELAKQNLNQANKNLKRSDLNADQRSKLEDQKSRANAFIESRKESNEGNES